MPNEVDLEIVKCPVCEHGRSRLWLNDGKPTQYVRCMDCGTVYASPRYIRQIRYAQTKASWGYTQSMMEIEAKRRPALKLEADLIQQYIHQGRMLDVGCSAGNFFEYFPLAQWERFGVELSETTAAFAAKTHSAQVAAGTLHTGHFPDRFYDLVSFIDMFYYVDDPLAELVEARRILKPQGIMALEIAGQAYMFARSRGLVSLLMEKRWCRLTTDSHMYWFNPRGLAQLLKKAGFSTFAWFVIPSPHSGNIFRDSMVGLHFTLLNTLSKLSYKSLTWAPKYICLARRIEDPA